MFSAPVAGNRYAPARSHGVGSNGFTLIEMVVVMVLLGLASGLVLPSMQRWHDAVRARAQVAQVVEALRGAIFSAAASRRDAVMDASSFSSAAPAGDAVAGSGQRRLRLPMPDGWRLVRVVDATFMANGLCRPGMALFDTDAGRRMVVKVAGPTCSVDTIADPGTVQP